MWQLISVPRVRMRNAYNSIKELGGKNYLALISEEAIFD